MYNSMSITIPSSLTLSLALGSSIYYDYSAKRIRIYFIKRRELMLQSFSFLVVAYIVIISKIIEKNS